MLDQWRANRANGNGRRLPEYAALATAIRGLLRDGRIPLGVRLPAERELADALGISRTTVTAAYRDLRETGHLTSRRGAGSFTAIPGGQRVGSAGLWTPEDTSDMIDLGCAAPEAPAQFTEAVAEAVQELPRYTAGAGYHPTGIPALRERIAAAFTARGLPTSPDQILVTTGAQQAVDLILRLLVSPGQAVLVESPTYPNVLAALRAHRMRVVTSSLDPVAGWEEELLLAELRSTRPAVAYLIPEFQNPTGHVMPHRLRTLLPSVAHRAGTDLIVDESFVDLRLDGPAEAAATVDTVDAGAAPSPVASFDAHARVLTVGGMSKPYWGGLRVGWIRAATPIIARLAALRVTVDMSGAVLDQLVAAALLDRAGEVLAARRRELRERRDVLVGALRQQLPQWTFTPPPGGMSLWVELDAPVSTALAQAAHEHGVRLAPGSLFGVAGTLERFIRLPFTLPGPDLVEAVRRLAAAHADLTRARPAAWTPPSLVA
jgi:Transcriptional regulators containing a DNA-binding HTH domain and an aminotransferase domain (MocR family) and their eukaryotic orthologs